MKSSFTSQHIFPIFTSLLILLTFPHAHAQPLAVESFDGATGDPISSLPSAPGWSTGWMANLELSQSLPLDYMIAAESLHSFAFRTHGLEPLGGRFQSPDSSALVRIVRGLEEPINWEVEGEYFISFLAYFSGSHASTSSRIKLNLGEETSQGPVTGGTFLALQGHGAPHSMRLTVRNQNETAHGNESYPADAVYFVVARLRTAGGGGLDEVAAVVYPPDAKVPANPPAEWQARAQRSRGGMVSFVSLDIQVYRNKSDVSVDELRIGTTWKSVTAPGR